MPIRIVRRVAAAALLAIAAMPVATAAQNDPRQPSALARATASQPVEIELRSASRVVAPGATVAIAIRPRPEPGWHSYWRHAGDVGSAPAVEWKLPDGFTAAPLRWPTPQLIAS